MQKANKMKGITLIALVVTIIVILILSGVTVATLMGENGIISKAQLAKEKTNEAQEEEKQQLESLENKLNEYANSRDIDAEELSTLVDELLDEKLEALVDELLDEKLSTLVDESIDEKINEVQTYTLSNEYINCVIKKNGNVKTVKFSTDIKKAMTKNTWYTLGTLPQAYRPITNSVYTAIVMGVTPTFATLSIDTSGNVKVYPTADRAIGTGIYTSIAYI